MIQIRPVSDLRNKFPEIEAIVNGGKPVYLTKNGYGAMVVLSLEEYASLAGQVFEEAKIPYFIDEKHSVLMNPFVEYVRAALEMVVQGFSYESVFRFLRTGLTGFSGNEIDILENYVRGLGIRGYKKWQEKWILSGGKFSPQNFWGAFSVFCQVFLWAEKALPFS